MENQVQSSVNSIASQLTETATDLLKQLIQIKRYSREEENATKAIEQFFSAKSIPVCRIGNNVIVKNEHFNERKPCILLNSHIDTVRPASSYTLDPFSPKEKDGKLFGLGSNDAGGALVSLIACFLYYYKRPELKYNLVLIASAEEEISGVNGIELALKELPYPFEFGIVGEPTLMQMAIAEKGLLVLDCESTGQSGHAAREEGINAIYKAMMDIETLRNYRFEKVSPLLGPVKLSVTSIETTNKQHNVIPDTCHFTIDARINELYTHHEIIAELKSALSCSLTPRSKRLSSSSIATDHPLVQSGLDLGLTAYGSPTISDQALIPFPTLKIGPGDSARSHSADEFIYLDEITQGINTYIQLLKPILQ